MLGSTRHGNLGARVNGGTALGAAVLQLLAQSVAVVPAALCYTAPMAGTSSIEWTDVTWNPVVGCTKVSPGCDRCYAERVTQRFPATFPSGFRLTLRDDALLAPLRWAKPRRVFVNSMSDLFHKDVPDTFIEGVFDVMARCPQHQFQILTKRAERLARLASTLPWPHHVWMGVSIETDAYLWRVDYLRRVPAAVRFVSAEPLLGSLANLDLAGIAWVIAGGESQAGARPAELDWFRELRDACRRTGVAFFLKQLGGHPHKRGGKDAVLDGQRWTEWPAQNIEPCPVGRFAHTPSKMRSAASWPLASISRYNSPP